MGETTELLRENIWYFLLFAILLTSLVINLNVTLQSEIVFGDEGFYAARGEWMSESLEMLQTLKFRSPSPVFKNYFLRPPMFIFSLASIFMLGGELVVKALMPFLSILTALMLFLLVRKLFSAKAGVLSAVFFLAIPSLITYSILLYAEVFGLLFAITSIYFLYRYFEGEERKLLVISGILAGFAVLSEVSLMPVILFIFLALWVYKKNYADFLKEIAIVGAVLFLCLSPWILVHNYYQFGNPGYNLNKFIDFPSTSVELKEVPDLDVGKFGGKKTGIKASILKMGVLNYVEFAYTFGFLIFSILGLSYFAIMRNKKAIFVLLGLIFVLPFVFTQSGESVARNTLGLVIPLAIGAGFFSNKIYEYLNSFKSTGRIIAVIFLVILLGWVLFGASSKAQSLKPKKQFSNSFFKGCDWIRKNTPEDSRVMTLWAARAVYNCKRSVFGMGANGIGDAVMAANNNTYEIFKMHGIDYVFVQKFSIKRSGRNRYPVEFVQYLEKSPKYQKVYSYPSQCLYKRGVADCSVVYKVKYSGEETGSKQATFPESLQQGV